MKYTLSDDSALEEYYLRQEEQRLDNLKEICKN